MQGTLSAEVCKVGEGLGKARGGGRRGVGTAAGVGSGRQAAGG